jgi:hypothetical protein
MQQGNQLMPAHDSIRASATTLAAAVTELYGMGGGV